MRPHIFSPFFTNKELKCKCPKCEEAYIDLELLRKLTNARKQANIPFIITSGCRCPEHNKSVKGSANSDHLADGIDFVCYGVDIKCNDNRQRFTIIKSLLDAGFNRIGLSHTFIHAGIDSRNPGDVIWFY